MCFMMSASFTLRKLSDCPTPEVSHTASPAAGQGDTIWPDHSVLLAPETELGPFEIVRLLGVGGMGEVYAARDRQLNRNVALKVLRADLAEPHRHARFEREALTASALNHPNICHTY